MPIEKVQTVTKTVVPQNDSEKTVCAMNEKPLLRRVTISAVKALQFSRDDKVLASAGDTLHAEQRGYYQKNHLKVEMLNAQTLKTARILPLLTSASLVAFSPALKRIVTSPTKFGGLQLFDATSGKSLWQEYT